MLSYDVISHVNTIYLIRVGRREVRIYVGPTNGNRFRSIGMGEKSTHGSVAFKVRWARRVHAACQTMNLGGVAAAATATVTEPLSLPQPLLESVQAITLLCNSLHWLLALESTFFFFFHLLLGFIFLKHLKI